jgi:hypothetical protein
MARFAQVVRGTIPPLFAFANNIQNAPQMGPQQSRTASLFAPHPSRKRRCHPAELQMSSRRDREPTRGGATLVAPATGVAAAGGPDPPHPAHHDGVAPVTSCRRGVAPGHAAWALQPLEKTARRKNATGWHRFCLLSRVDSAAGTTARGDGGGAAQEMLGGGNLSGAACRATQSSSWHMGEAKAQIVEPWLR